jgi:hypothetical protein
VGRPAVVVYAHVAKDGKLLSDSRNMKQSNVRRLKAGLYCIQHMAASLHSAVAAPSFGSGAVGAAVHDAKVNCNFLVYTVKGSGTLVDSGFFIQFA